MTDIRFQTVAVLGAGTMGAGIAQVSAQAGSRVVLQDIKPEFVDKGLQRIRDSLAVGVQKQKLTQEQADATLSRITATTDRAAAARAADLVIEAVPEILDLKNSLFLELSSHAKPDCVLGTNTSSLSLQKVFAGVKHPERCIGMHYFNPPPIMKLLEVVRTDATSQSTIEAVNPSWSRTARGSRVRAWASASASKRSAWLQQASRARKTSTRRWSSVTATPWVR